MTTPSPKLGLALPGQSDPFSTKDVADNWSKIDASPGAFICTSSTRPPWTSAQAGRTIFETNTGLEWWWNGTGWLRKAPSGLLRRSDGSPAYATRPQDFASGYTTFYVMVALTGVVVPAGNRPLRLDATWLSGRTMDAPNAAFLAIYQSAANQAGARIAHWLLQPGPKIGSDNHANLDGGTMSGFVPNGLAAGVYDFSFQMRAYTLGPLVTINGDGNSPMSLTCTEL